MSTNLFSRLQALLPPSPMLIARVIETHADDTSTVSLPINAGDTVLSPGLSQGRLLRVRGSQVPAGANCFIRDGLIESRAPDGDPTLVVIGRVAPTPPSTKQLARNGTIAAQTIQLGDAYTLDLRPFWKDGFAPFTYTHAGALPAGLTFVGANGQIAGTPTSAGVSTITPSCTDATLRTVQQSAFTITVSLAPYRYWISTTLGSRSRKTMAFGNGRFVVSEISASGNATASWSADGGASWVEASTEVAGSFGSLGGIAFGNGVFVAQVNAILMASSPDGDTWTGYNHSSLSTDGDIWFGNGEFFICGRGAFLTTLTGTSVARSGSLPTNYGNLHGAYGAGKYVAIGSSGACYSSDGDTWTAASIAAWAPSSYPRIAFGNGRFVIVGSSASATTYLHSVNGSTWVEGNLPSARQWREVIFAEGRFLASNSDSRDLAASTDGVTWELLPTDRRFTSDSGFSRMVNDGSNRYVAYNLGSSTLANRTSVFPPVLIIASARSAAVGTDFSVPAHQAGDLLVLMLKRGSGTAPGTPSGWTSRASRDLSIGSGWRVASRVDTSNSVTTITGAWASVMIVVVVRGGRIGAVGSSGEALVPNGGSQALPNLTLETPGESLVLAGVMSNGGGSAFSSLPGVTVLQDNTAPSLGGGNHGVFASTAPEATFSGRSIVVDTVFGAFVSAWAIELASA